MTAVSRLQDKPPLRARQDAQGAVWCPPLSHSGQEAGAVPVPQALSAHTSILCHHLEDAQGTIWDLGAPNTPPQGGPFFSSLFLHILSESQLCARPSEDHSRDKNAGPGPELRGRDTSSLDGRWSWGWQYLLPGLRGRPGGRVCDL